MWTIADIPGVVAIILDTMYVRLYVKQHAPYKPRLLLMGDWLLRELIPLIIPAVDTHIQLIPCKTCANKAIRDGKYLAPPHASAWQRSPH